MFRRFAFSFQAKPSRLHCSHCDDTYSLPQNGTIKLYKELRCPLDDFELVLWSSGSRGKSYPLCPYCYNHPPFRDMKKGIINKRRGCSSNVSYLCESSLWIFLNMRGCCYCILLQDGRERLVCFELLFLLQCSWSLMKAAFVKIAAFGARIQILQD